jgi:predicted nucleic acid-binding protein
MAEVFADTSGWASFLVRTERHHALANRLMQQWQANNTRVVTSTYVLTELVALLTSPLRVPRPTQIQFFDDLKTASWVDVVVIDAACDTLAWTLLKARPDKEWSLVDCASFVLMQQRGIADALTTDHHFEQAGFVRLLKQ